MSQNEVSCHVSDIRANFHIFPSKSFTASYIDSCFGVLEVCHISCEFTICDAEAESTINVLLSCSFFDVLR